MPTELERRARELLAAEYRADGVDDFADEVLKRPFELLNRDEKRALRAIVAALQAQQPGAQAVAQAPNRVRTEVYEDGKWRTLCVYGFSRPDTQPPSIPEPSEEDVELAHQAYSFAGGPVFKRIRAALTTYTARLRERIGQAPGGDGDA
jgi:hypothetical protein